MPIDQTEYQRATAIIAHATITRSVSFSYPDLSTEDRDAMIIDIIDRLARLRGWAIKRDFVLSEDDS